jgi:nicotinate phosphoribosyltransferase
MSLAFTAQPQHYNEDLARFSAIWGDLYALTMAQALFTMGKHNVNTTFHAYVRKNPFDGGYLKTGGQNIIADWYEKWAFDETDIALLREATIVNPATGLNERLFCDDFIDMVAHAKPELTMDMMPEGELAFPDEPIIRSHGPVWQNLMVESPMLNIGNSQGLFATLATRLKGTTLGEPLLAFGMRRAQAIGGLEPARGAYLGGADATSNTLARKNYGLPWAGTFAHAYVMFFEDELEAFNSYAQAMPANGIFLVDTYDTLEGVKKAIKACKEADAPLKGIRLDSGDMAWLSIEARKILDEAGYTDAKIAASNDLDEASITELKARGAKIDVWGVGTNLETAKAQPALGMVYKLAAVYDESLSVAQIEAIRNHVKQGHVPDEGFVRDVIKLSEEDEKVTIPGEMNVVRMLRVDEQGHPIRFDGDVIVPNLARDPIKNGKLAYDITSVPKTDESKVKTFKAGTPAYCPLTPAFNKGSRVIAHETIHEARARADKQFDLLDDSHKARVKPHPYRVGLEEGLFKKRRNMKLSRRVK